MRKKVRTFDLEFSPPIQLFSIFSLFKEHLSFLHITPSSPYSPSDIVREIYNKNAYLKLICETLG